MLDENRFFEREGYAAGLAKELFNSVETLPIISPHGHTDPKWFADNMGFGNATELLLTPDHYVLRMLYSQGIPLGNLAVKDKENTPSPCPRDAWKVFADHYYLFRGTPSRIWMDYVFSIIFNIERKLTPETADYYYDKITNDLQTDRFKPLALMDEFNIELLATTEGALDPLTSHNKLNGTIWQNRIITTFRPDDVIDASRPDFRDNVLKLGEITNQDTSHWTGYLQALRDRRQFFKSNGATATDHGHPTPLTCDLSLDECVSLYQVCFSGKSTPVEQERFRGQMLTEMAGMSLEDGLVMQLHPGSDRNHNSKLYSRFGADKGCDIPRRVNYVDGLRALLNKYGNETDLTLIVFTLDETTYSRELAPLAGHYPCLKLGPAWWFHDSFEGMLRYRRQTTETAGFYNTAGFNDDTRAFLSIPARHDLARRVDSRYLAELVSDYRLTENEAHELIHDLTTNLVRNAYKLR